MVLYVNAENETYFICFGAEQILKKIKNSLEIKMLKEKFIEYKHTIQ